MCVSSALPSPYIATLSLLTQKGSKGVCQEIVILNQPCQHSSSIIIYNVT